MKKIYYLGTCDNCRDIISDLQNLPGFERQEIKSEPITAEQLDYLKTLVGSYEALFNKRAKLYKEWKLKDKFLKEHEYRSFLLKEYTFLKRPVIVSGDQIFVGQEKKTIKALKESLT
jgi:arsenate reductase